VPRLCEFYPGICLTTEEKARKTLSQGKTNLSQVIICCLDLKKKTKISNTADMRYIILIEMLRISRYMWPMFYLLFFFNLPFCIFCLCYDRVPVNGGWRTSSGTYTTVWITVSYMIILLVHSKVTCDWRVFVKKVVCSWCTTNWGIRREGNAGAIGVVYFSRLSVAESYTENDGVNNELERM